MEIPEASQNGTSPASDVSPRTVDPNSGGYFSSPESPKVSAELISKTSNDPSIGAGDDGAEPKSITFGTLSKPSEMEKGNSNSNSTTADGSVRRKSSVSSVTFRQPRTPGLPQGEHQIMGGSRIRASSPPHQRYVDFLPFERRETLVRL